MTDEEMNRILQKTMRKIENEEKGKEEMIEEKMDERKGHSKKRIAVLAIAATLCLGTVFGFATGYFHASDSLKGFLGITDDEAVANMGTVVGTTAEVDGWTLNVKEVLGDSNSIYLLYDVIAPEGTVLDDSQHTFRNQRIDMTAFSGGFGAGWYSEELPDADATDNVKSFVLCADCSDKMQGKTLNVTLGNFSKYTPEEQDFETLLEKDFVVDVPLEYDVESKIVKINEPVDIFEGEAALKSVEISPISAIITIKGDGVAAYDESPADLENEEYVYPEDKMNIKLIMKDGSIVDEFRGTGTNTHGNEFKAIMAFNELIDMDKVAAVEVCGQTIQISK